MAADEGRGAVNPKSLADCVRLNTGEADDSTELAAGGSKKLGKAAAKLGDIHPAAGERFDETRVGADRDSDDCCCPARLA